MSPETQTFVSRTTRSARLPHLADCLGDFSLDFLLGHAELAPDPVTATKKCLEASLPLVCGDASCALRREPGVHGLAHEDSDGFAPLLSETAKELELLVVEIDVRALHRSYIIHRIVTRSLDAARAAAAALLIAYVGRLGRHG
jgi:hypothetical protein